VPDDGELRVASFNILHTRDDDADDTLDRRIGLVADALAQTNADVVGLQEVTRSANHGMVAERVAGEMAGRTGDDWSWCFFQSNPHLPDESDEGPGGVGGPTSRSLADLAREGDAPWAEGVAVLSRQPIVDQAAHRLPSRAAEAPTCGVENPDDPLAAVTCQFDTRTVLWARVDTACGGFDMFTSHLANTASSMSEETRLAQITDALAQIDQLATDEAAPDAYVGDFNTLEGGQVWRAAVDVGFVDAFRTAAPDDPGFTAGQLIGESAPTVDARIDYVFARSGSTTIEPRRAEVIGDTPSPVADGSETVVWPSDHYGVAVTLLDEASCTDVAGRVPPGPSTDSTPGPEAGTSDGGPPGWLVGTILAALAIAVGVVVLNRSQRHRT